jgi:PIN domain nuclease of toxin-antitoxin system
MFTFVLDACAIIALLMREDGCDIVEHLFKGAKRGSSSIIVNKYNLLEVYYGFYRQCGKDFAEEQINKILASPIKVIDVLSDDVFYFAGKLKSQYKISLADAVLLAQGFASSGVVITSEHHEFDAIFNDGTVNIFFIR